MRSRQTQVWCLATLAWTGAVTAWLGALPILMGCSLALLALSGGVLAWGQRAAALGPAGAASGGDAGSEAADCLSEASALWLAHLQTAQTQMREATDELLVGFSDILQQLDHIVASGPQAHEQEEARAQVLTRCESQLNGLMQNFSAFVQSREQILGSVQTLAQRSGGLQDMAEEVAKLARQTNLLSINAAIEAARAGDSGRGFAVVAAEVRSLAQRSAQAASEIKALIQTSVQAVDVGVRQVEDAGKTMKEIVDSVQRVGDIIGEITAASSEQSGGIGQVNQAVGDIDRMTQQNAALVEESAAAAESLREQAARLAQVVGQFRIAGAAVASMGSHASYGRPSQGQPSLAPAAGRASLASGRDTRETQLLEHA